MGTQQIITDWGTFVTGGRFTFCVLWSNAIRIEVGGNGLSGNIVVNDGNWHHVAGVYNPAATSQVSLYVDGVLDVAGNLTVATNTVSGTGVQIGQRIDNARRFDGTIDDVRVWSVARAQADIAANRNNEICTLTPGLEAYYNCNAGIAGGTNTGVTILRDYSGNGRDGTLTNFALTGSTYVQSGTYAQTLMNAVGCDSVISLDLTINPADTIDETISQCVSYYWPADSMTYTQSGNYSALLTNAIGCDSLVRLSLAIQPIDTSITNNGLNGLSANLSGGTYQWLACDNGFFAIPGATMQGFLPSQNGSFAVVVTNGACSDTSNCHTAIVVGTDDGLPGEISLYPNPNTGRFALHFGQVQPHIKIAILNPMGQAVFQSTHHDVSQMDMQPFLATGLYFVRIETTTGAIRVLRLMVKN